MKEIKRIVLFSLIVNCMFGCKRNNAEEQMLKDDKSYGTVYFVIDDIDTDIAVTCDNYLNDLNYFIYSLKIIDEELLNKVLSKKEIDKKLGYNYVVDVRYRIESKDKIICIDDFGNYSVDNKFIGKLSNFQLLLDYIEKHKESSVKLKEDFPFEDVK